MHLVNVNSVRIPQALARIEKRLPDDLRDAKFPEPHLVSTTNQLVAWMKPRLPKTLSYNEAASEAEWRQVEKRIDESPEYKVYTPGTPLALSNRSINPESMHLLRLEHAAQVKKTSWTHFIFQSLASFGLYIAL